MLLTTEQKRALCMLAREAWESRSPARAAERRQWLDANPGMSDGQVWTAWRRHHQARATGCPTLTRLTQDDYLRLRAYWEDMSGRHTRAFETLLRAEDEPAARAYAVLRRNLAERGLPEAYAEAICRRQFRCTLREASERQLWCLVFTVRNRRAVVGHSHTHEVAQC